MIPAIFSLLLSIAFLFGAHPLFSGIGEEKESRLIEVFILSASATQLLIAKLLAWGTTGLLQVLVYSTRAPLLLSLASSSFGGISSSTAEAQNLSMFYIKMCFEPPPFFGVIVNFPRMPTGVGLSIFPVTASFQAMLRLGVSGVPAWQIVGGVGVLELSVLLGLSLSMKIFKTLMIGYGKRPGVAEIIQALKTACGLRLKSRIRSAPKPQGRARMCSVLCG